MRGATAQLLWDTLPLSLIRGLPWAAENSQVLSFIKCVDHSLSGLTYLVLLLVSGHAKQGSHSLTRLIDIVRGCWITLSFSSPSLCSCQEPEHI